MSGRRRSVSETDRRSDARERSMTLLYEAETKALPAQLILDAQIVHPDELTCLLVGGVAGRRAEIDELIRANARGWTLERMPEIDKTVLRIAIFELIDRPEVPKAVVIDEAVRLAKRFSTDDSGRFVNGMLTTISKIVRPPSHTAAATDPGPNNH
jgi:transcription antitermination protein NusB